MLLLTLLRLLDVSCEWCSLNVLYRVLCCDASQPQGPKSVAVGLAIRLTKPLQVDVAVDVADQSTCNSVLQLWCRQFSEKTV